MSGPGKRVLYIDDDVGLARLVEKHLSRLSYTVSTATDGPSGIARLAGEAFDVVALDHYMPGQDGLDTLAAIMRLEDPPPVVYVTGTDEGRIAIAALKAGAADYVIKSVDEEFLELLRAALDNAVEAVQLRRARAEAEAEIRAARDRFEELANERALLLREVNHRVGNSLQLIASFLQLQGGATSAPEVRHALNEARSRVMAVSQVHRRLYTSENVRVVAADQYLESLIADLRYTVQDVGSTEDLTVAAEPLELDPDRTVALGVVVTELVINAAKYAYPEGAGPIRVRLARRGEAAELVVEDDGVGSLGSGGGAAASTGLGTSIVKAMAAKLGAGMTLDPAHRGTRVRLAFPLVRHEEAVAGA